MKRNFYLFFVFCFYFCFCSAKISIPINSISDWQKCSLAEDAPLSYNFYQNQDAISGNAAVKLIFDSSKGVTGMKYLKLPNISGSDGYSFWVRGDNSGASLQIRLSQSDWSAWDSPYFTINWTNWKKIIIKKEDCTFHNWGKNDKNWNDINIFAVRISEVSCELLIDELNFHSNIQNIADKIPLLNNEQFNLIIDMNEKLPPVGDNLKGLDLALVNWGADKPDLNFNKNSQSLFQNSGCRLARFWPFCPPLGVAEKQDSYNWTKFDKQMEILKQNNVNIIMTCCFTPKWLSIDGTKEGMPKDFTAYEKLIIDLTTHCKEKNFPVIYWEVWNEPDLPNGGFLNGSINEFNTIYKHFVKGVRTAAPDAKVGGGGFSAPDISWVKNFLYYASNEKLPLDFISWHTYSLSPSGLGNSIELMRSEINKYEHFKQAELIIDEWNSSGGKDNSYDTYFTAAYQTAAFYQMLTHKLDASVFFAFKESAYHYKIKPPVNGEFGGSWGIITLKNNPKPSFHSFRLFSSFNKELYKVSGGNNKVNAIAGQTENGTGVLLFSFEPSPDAVSKNIKITITNSDYKRYDLKISLIDKEHTNPIKNPNQTNLQIIQTLHNQTDNKLPVITIDPVATTYLEIIPQK